MIDGDRIVHEVRYPHPVDDVWRALTDSSALASWLMPNDFAPEVGRRFRFDARPEFGLIDGEVIDVKPPHLLRCRWTVDGVPTTLTIWLETDGSGTLLRLEHSGLPADPRASFHGGWASKLKHDLALTLDGADHVAVTQPEEA